MGTQSTKTHRRAARGLAFAAMLSATLAAIPADAQDREVRHAPSFATPLPTLVAPFQPPGPDPVGGLATRPVPPSVAGNDHDSCQWTNANIAECETTICLEPLDEGDDITCHVITECYDHYGHRVPCP